MTKVTIKRGSGWLDHFRAYTVWVDGEKVGRVRDGEKLELNVSAGEHAIRCTIDWARTEPFTFVAIEGEEVQLEVGICSEAPWDYFLGRYLTIERADLA